MPNRARPSVLRLAAALAIALAFAASFASQPHAQTGAPGKPAAPAKPSVAPPPGTPTAPGATPSSAPPAADTPTARSPAGNAAPDAAPAAPPPQAAPAGSAAPATGSQGGAGKAPERVVRIGTNAVNGLYFPTGGALCRMLTRPPNPSAIRCLVESTSGSTANVRGLRNGDLEFGIVQSDWQYYAVQGNGVFKANGPVRELRAVLSLYPESLTVLARQDSGIADFEQIKGKRIAAGPQGSGQRILFDTLVAAHGWRLQDAGTLTEATDGQAAEAFCNGTVDVVVMMTHHPAPFVQDMISRCHARFVPVAGPAVAKLIKDRPYYAPSAIPADAYRGLEGDTQTLGVRATLVTSAAVPDDVVYALVKSVFDNLDLFMAQHPGLGGLKREDMVKAALTAPLHEGARRYFREKGLLP